MKAKMYGEPQTGRVFAPVRSESRSRIGIDWYATEAQADEAAVFAKEQGVRQAALGYDFGYMSIGRATYFDMIDQKTEQTIYAVVTP